MQVSCLLSARLYGMGLGCTLVLFFFSFLDFQPADHSGSLSPAATPPRGPGVWSNATFRRLVSCLQDYHDS